MLDADTRAVIGRLDAALATSGLSMRQFSRTLGTSPSRFSSYRTGRVAPTAAFLIRAERIANAIRQARRDGVPTILDAVDSIRRAERRGEDDWTYALVLEARDRLRDVLRNHEELVGSWEGQPSSGLGEEWMALLAAFVDHEFIQSDLHPPRWTSTARLASAWVLDTPRLNDEEIRRQTPTWLSDRNIFIAEKDLLTP